jgi:hypothetical protein
MTQRSTAALSTNLQKAVQWISDIMQEYRENGESLNSPEKQRNQVISDAQLRFDLTPAECEFLNHNFKELVTG